MAFRGLIMDELLLIMDEPYIDIMIKLQPWLTMTRDMVQKAMIMDVIPWTSLDRQPGKLTSIAGAVEAAWSG